MNPETANPDSSDYTTNEVEKPAVAEVDPVETQLLLPPSSSAQPAIGQWQQYGEQIAAFVEDLPSYVTRFFEENKGILTSLGLILGALMAIKLTLALVDAINDIPLVALTLELIGLGYTSWFVYRYLLSAASRQELSEKVKTIKAQILGTQQSS